MPDPVIGYCRFVDGLPRPIYEYAHGQYVLDDGERVYGLCVVLNDKERNDALHGN